MSEIVDGVRDNYRATGLAERLKTALTDDTEVATAWFAQMRESGPPPSPNLGVVMGRTSRSLPPIWDEISWKAGSAS